VHNTHIPPSNNKYLIRTHNTAEDKVGSGGSKDMKIIFRNKTEGNVSKGGCRTECEPHETAILFKCTFSAAEKSLSKK
jgi:hypothetical protein